MISEEFPLVTCDSVLTFLEDQVNKGKADKSLLASWKRKFSMNKCHECKKSKEMCNTDWFAMHCNSCEERICTDCIMDTNRKHCYECKSYICSTCVKRAKSCSETREYTDANGVFHRETRYRCMNKKGCNSR